MKLSLGALKDGLAFFHGKSVPHPKINPDVDKGHARLLVRKVIANAMLRNLACEAPQDGVPSEPVKLRNPDAELAMLDFAQSQDPPCGSIGLAGKVPCEDLGKNALLDQVILLDVPAVRLSAPTEGAPVRTCGSIGLSSSCLHQGRCPIPDPLLPGHCKLPPRVGGRFIFGSSCEEDAASQGCFRLHCGRDAAKGI